MKVQFNKHPAGRISNIVFGLLETFDGIVRVLSLGFLHTTSMVDYTREQTKKGIAKLKLIRGARG